MPILFCKSLVFLCIATQPPHIVAAEPGDVSEPENSSPAKVASLAILFKISSLGDNALKKIQSASQLASSPSFIFLKNLIAET